MQNLEKKTTEELEELFRQQRKVLDNRVLVSRLKDGGAKARELCERIERVLHEQKSVENMTIDISCLSLAEDLRTASASVVKRVEALSNEESQSSNREKFKPYRTLRHPKDCQEPMSVPSGDDFLSRQSVDAYKGITASYFRNGQSPDTSKGIGLVVDTTKSVRTPASGDGLSGVLMNRFADSAVAPTEPTKLPKILTLVESVKIAEEKALVAKSLEMRRAAERLSQRFSLDQKINNDLGGILDKSVVNRVQFNRYRDSQSGTETDSEYYSASEDESQS